MQTNFLSSSCISIYLGLINHVIMEAYSECWGTNVHCAHSIVIYYPMDPNRFKELIVYSKIHVLITNKSELSKD
jgi:hypothetical protein